MRTVSLQLASLGKGAVVGPVVSESTSRHLAVSSLRTIEWLAWLLSEGRLLAVLLAPLPFAASRRAYVDAEAGQGRGSEASQCQ